MVKFETFLLKNEINSLEDTLKKPQVYFLKIKQRKKYNFIDFENLEGVITLSIDNEMILKYDTWCDFIDDLWYNYIIAVEKYYEIDFSFFNYPDQNIKIELKKSNASKLILTIIRNEYSRNFIVDECTFFTSLLNSATAFFNFCRVNGKGNSNLLLTIEKYEKKISKIVENLSIFN